MRTILFYLLDSVLSNFRSRAVLQLEIIVLRHQLDVLQRTRSARVRLTRLDRILWLLLYRLWPRCLDAMVTSPHSRRSPQTTMRSPDTTGHPRLTQPPACENLPNTVEPSILASSSSSQLESHLRQKRESPFRFTQMKSCSRRDPRPEGLSSRPPAAPLRRRGEASPPWAASGSARSGFPPAPSMAPGARRARRRRAGWPRRRR